MAGVAGRSGTNKGKDKPWREALMMEVNEADGDSKKLRRIARALVDQACNGDVQAIKEIGDRLDGKPRQETEISGSEGGPILIQEVRRVIVDSHNSDTEGVQTASGAEPL